MEVVHLKMRDLDENRTRLTIIQKQSPYIRTNTSFTRFNFLIRSWHKTLSNLWNIKLISFKSHRSRYKIPKRCITSCMIILMREHKQPLRAYFALINPNILCLPKLSSKGSLHCCRILCHKVLRWSELRSKIIVPLLVILNKPGLVLLHIREY